MSMNINTVLSKSVDNQTTKNLIQSLQGKQTKKIKNIIFHIYAQEVIKIVGLIQIYVEIKKEKNLCFW